MAEVKKVLVIGAAGAIGKCLVEHMLLQGLEVVAALRKSPLPDDLTRTQDKLTCIFGVDCTDAASIRKCFAENEGTPIDTVWNLAAPLSVETAQNPQHAFNVVVNGMDIVLKIMRDFNVSRICFSDSIGSYGGSSPRDNVSARWLVENPTQDPGSDYGVQKRQCRALMKAFVEEVDDGSRSCRWAVIPGVLHDDLSWGAGTTEYALDALCCAAKGLVFKCPIEVTTILPMIYRPDLIRGLYALMIAPNESLLEPDGGYALAGLSFSGLELFEEIRRWKNDFQYTVEEDSEKILKESAAAVFANLWPNSLTGEQATRDLKFTSEVTQVSVAVDIIMEKWAARLL